MFEPPADPRASSPPSAGDDGADPPPAFLRLGVFVGLALFGALWDLIGRRAWLLTLGDRVPQADRAAWFRTASFGFNLATLSGAVALVIGLWQLVRRGYVPRVAAFGMVVFGTIFFIGLGLGVSDPHPGRLGQMYAIAAGFMWMSLLCIAGIRAGAARLQLAFGLWSSMVFSSLLVRVFEIAEARELLSPLKAYNEVVFLAVPLVVAAAYGSFSRRALPVTLLSALVVGLGLSAWQWSLDTHYPGVLYGTFAVDALGPAYVGAYAPLLGLVVGSTVGTLGARRPSVSVALFLYLCAQQLPRSLGLLTLHLLALLLIVLLAYERPPRPPKKAPPL